MTKISSFVNLVDILDKYDIPYSLDTPLEFLENTFGDDYDVYEEVSTVILEDEKKAMDEFEFFSGELFEFFHFYYKEGFGYVNDETFSLREPIVNFYEENLSLNIQDKKDKNINYICNILKYKKEKK